MLWREQHLARFDFTGRHTGGGQGSEDARGRAGRQHSLQVCPQVGARALHALARGVGRVVIAMADPHPRNRGAGVRILADGGITVTLGVLEATAQADLAPYIWQPSMDGAAAEG